MTANGTQPQNGLITIPVEWQADGGFKARIRYDGPDAPHGLESIVDVLLGLTTQLRKQARAQRQSVIERPDGGHYSLG